MIRSSSIRTRLGECYRNLGEKYERFQEWWAEDFSWRRVDLLDMLFLGWLVAAFLVVGAINLYLRFFGLPKSRGRRDAVHPAATVKGGESVQWINSALSWIYLHYTSTPELIESWLRALNEQARKHPCEYQLKFDRIQAGSVPPKFTQVTTDVSNNENLVSVTLAAMAFPAHIPGKLLLMLALLTPYMYCDLTIHVALVDVAGSIEWADELSKELNTSSYAHRSLSISLHYIIAHHISPSHYKELAGALLCNGTGIILTNDPCFAHPLSVHLQTTGLPVVSLTSHLYCARIKQHNLYAFPSNVVLEQAIEETLLGLKWNSVNLCYNHENEALFHIISSVFEKLLIKYQLYTLSNATISADYSSMLDSSQTAGGMEKNNNLVCCGGSPLMSLLGQDLLSSITSTLQYFLVLSNDASAVLPNVTSGCHKVNADLMNTAMRLLLNNQTDHQTCAACTGYVSDLHWDGIHMVPVPLCDERARQLDPRLELFPQEKQGFRGRHFMVSTIELAKGGVNKDVWDGMATESVHDPVIMSVDDRAHIDRVNEGDYVYISDRTLLEKISTSDPTCKLILLPALFLPMGLGVGLPEGSPHTSGIETAIGSLQQSGMLKFWEQKWGPKEKCSSLPIPEAHAISLLDTQSAFCLLGGMFFATCMLIAETARHKVRCYLDKETGGYRDRGICCVFPWSCLPTCYII